MCGNRVFLLFVMISRSIIIRIRKPSRRRGYRKCWGWWKMELGRHLSYFVITIGVESVLLCGLI